jgi:hypothetical protein
MPTVKVVRLRKLLNSTGYQWWAVLAVLTALGIIRTVNDLLLPAVDVFADIRAKAVWALPYQIVLSGVFAALAVRHWRVERRLERVKGGLCAQCGYDLRASPGNCPECGLPRSAGTTAAR